MLCKKVWNALLCPGENRYKLPTGTNYLEVDEVYSGVYSYVKGGRQLLRKSYVDRATDL